MENNSGPTCIKVVSYYNSKNGIKQYFYLFCVKINKKKSHYFLASDRNGRNIVETSILRTSKNVFESRYTGLGKYFTCSYPSELRVMNDIWSSENVRSWRPVRVYKAICSDYKWSNNWFTGISTKDAEILNCVESVFVEGTLYVVQNPTGGVAFLFKPNGCSILYTVSEKSVTVEGMNFRVVDLTGANLGFSVGLIGVPSEIEYNKLFSK